MTLNDLKSSIKRNIKKLKMLVSLIKKYINKRNWRSVRILRISIKTKIKFVRNTNFHLNALFPTS